MAAQRNRQNLCRGNEAHNSLENRPQSLLSFPTNPKIEGLPLSNGMQQPESKFTPPFARHAGWLFLAVLHQAPHGTNTPPHNIPLAPIYQQYKRIQLCSGKEVPILLSSTHNCTIVGLLVGVSWCCVSSLAPNCDKLFFLCTVVYLLYHRATQSCLCVHTNRG